MKHKLLILLIISIASVNTAKCVTVIAYPDTLSKPWRLNKQEFLKKFGEDDTTRALINYWYNERHLLFGLTTASVIVGAGGGIGLLSLNTHGSVAAYAGIGYVVLVAFGIITFPVFLMALLFRSRKKLFRLISDHKEGKRLRKGLRKRLHIKPT